MSSEPTTTTATADGEPPQWPADVLYLPVAADGKGPDLSALPGTWDTDGTGCTPYDELTDRRWGIVDTARDGWRLLTVDLDVHKMDTDRAERVEATITDGAPTRVHTSQSGGRHVFYWVPTDALTDDGTLPVTFGDHIDDKLNGYVLSPHCEGYTVATERQPAVLRDATALPDEWLNRDTHAEGTRSDDTATHTGGEQALNGVYDVLARASYPEGERVSHPYHPSDTGTNFMVDAGGDTWRCWRHDCTGNAGHLLGIEQGVISCGEWVPGGLDAPTWREIYDAARAAGYDIPDRPRTTDTPDVRAVWDEHADVIKDAESPVARMRLADPVFEEMARAELLADGEPDLWIAELADIDRKVDKTTIREQYESVRADVRGALADGGGDDVAPPLDEWLRDHIGHVEVRILTDGAAPNRYTWVLADDVADAYRTDRFTTTGTAHNKWQNLDDAIFEALGVEVSQPSGHRADNGEFPQWIKSFINDRRVNKEVAGPRTQAIEWLADTIHRSRAYPTVDAMLDSGGPRHAVWMPEPNADELAVKSAWIGDVVDEFNIKYQGLHHELERRGYLEGGSQVHYRDGGRQIRLWHLSTDLAEPRTFEHGDDT